MAYYYGTQHTQPSSSSSNSSSHNINHHGRSRRGPRLSSQNSHRQFRGVRSMKELTDAPVVSAFRVRFEACKGFDLDDDLEFCPGLLTEDDFQSISSSSDRSSLSSGSPSSSPLQQQAQPTQQVSPPFSLATTFQHSSSYHLPQSPVSHPPQMKLYQPSAMRTRNAIPIVNPNTGMRVPSPPTSISPSRMQQQQQQQAYTRRW